MVEKELNDQIQDQERQLQDQARQIEELKRQNLELTELRKKEEAENQETIKALKKDDFETRPPVIFAGDIFDEEAFFSLL